MPVSETAAASADRRVCCIVEYENAPYSLVLALLLAFPDVFRSAVP